MSLMMSSCCTFRLKRRRALSIDSPSWTLHFGHGEYTPSTADNQLSWARNVWAECASVSQLYGPSMLGYHIPASRRTFMAQYNPFRRIMTYP